MMENKKETSQVTGITREVTKETFLIDAEKFANKVIEKGVMLSHRDRYFQ